MINQPFRLDSDVTSWLAQTCHITNVIISNGDLTFVSDPTHSTNQNMYFLRIVIRVMRAGKLNFERGQKRSKMTFLGLKMIIFGHFQGF